VQLHQLEYLVAVADEGGFTAAAERLHVAQPGVSAQVRKLERELGHPLFDRSGHRVRPTTVGEEVLRPARAALAAVAEVRHVVDELAGLVRGRLRVGAVTSGPFLDVPDVLAGFTRAHPDVEVTLVGGGSADLLDAVRAGRLDAALVGWAGAPPADLAALPVTDEVLVAITTPDDPLAGRVAVTGADLAARSLVAPAPGGALRDALDLLLAREGREGVRVAFEATDPAVVARLVARGLGVAVLPASVLGSWEGALVGVPLAGPPLASGLSLVWPAPGTPATRALVRAVRDALSGSAGGAQPNTTDRSGTTSSTP
jgi:DNA-binding transcriptional LysR family regulator